MALILSVASYQILYYQLCPLIPLFILRSTHSEGGKSIGSFARSPEQEKGLCKSGGLKGKLCQNDGNFFFCAFLSVDLRSEIRELENRVIRAPFRVFSGGS